MAPWIPALFGAAAVPGTARGRRGAGAGAAGAEVLLTPGAARPGHGASPQPIPHQHGSADPGNAVQELVEGVRPQQCCG